jgi:hypothetical protein
MKRNLALSLVVFLALVVVGTQLSWRAEAQALEANAGADQTVPGPSPVAVQFNGSGSTGNIASYRWLNQWGQLRAEGESPIIEVNFGYKNPQPGTTRTFSLVVTDAAGTDVQDAVTVTLGSPEKPPPDETPPPDDPANRDPLIGSVFTGSTYIYEVSDANMYVFQHIDVGILVDQGQWYVGNNHPAVATAQVVCHVGVPWRTDPGDGSVWDDGCTGPARAGGTLELLPQQFSNGQHTWQVVLDGVTVATISQADAEIYALSSVMQFVDYDDWEG